MAIITLLVSNISYSLYSAIRSLPLRLRLFATATTPQTAPGRRLRRCASCSTRSSRAGLGLRALRSWLTGAASARGFERLLSNILGDSIKVFLINFGRFSREARCLTRRSREGIWVRCASP